jgi:chitinase
VISPNGGTFRRKITVTIFCATSGATIHYTTDGSDPTTSSPVYPAGSSGGRRKTKRLKGIAITGKGQHTVRAMAVEPGETNSAIAVANYAIH